MVVLSLDNMLSMVLSHDINMRDAQSRTQYIQKNTFVL